MGKNIAIRVDTFGGLMRSCLRILAIALLTVLIISMASIAAERIVCDVEVVTDDSVKVTLNWSENSKEGKMITSWDFKSDDTLVVYYNTGGDVPAGFDSRTISDSRYVFPMKVHLEQYVGHTPEFTDLSASDPGVGEILNLYYRGIIGGYPDGSFKASNNVTRAEFSKMLLLTAKYSIDDGLMSSFTDVNDSHWGRKYIMTLASKEILKGKGEGKFDPSGPIKMGEVLAVIGRTFDMYGPKANYPYTLDGHWSDGDFQGVVADGLVISSDAYYHPYKPEVLASRQDCAILLSRVLENLHDVTK